MSKTCKKLLASALAVTMLFSTFVTSLVVSAATTGTLEIGTKTITAGVDTSATVDFTLTFTEAVEAPHELATIVAMNENDEALTITDVVLGDVTYSDGYVDENLDVNDPELEVPALRIKTDGINKTAGKVLFESGVDSAVKASVINFTVTFDTTNATVGTYTVSAVIDSTDLDESEIVVTAEDGAIVVAEPHVCSAGEATDNGDGTHDIACAGCDKLFADNETCNYVDGVCSVCGAKEPVVEPECDHANATLEYAVVDGNCVTTKVCPDCDVAPEVIATIANTTTDVKQSIVLAEGLAINFRTVASAVSEYTSIYGEFKKDVYSGNTVTGTTDSTVVAKEETVSKVLYQTCKYEGIASYEMTSNIHLSLYGTDANGNVVLLRDLDYKFVDYLDSQYSKLTGIYRNVLGRLADYGTYIQLMNSYHTDHVPNASTPSDLIIDLPTTFNNTAVTETGIKINSTPKVGNTLTVNYRILKTDISAHDDFSLTISYVDAFNAAQTITVSYSAGDFTTYKSGGKEYWSYEFKGLVAAKINEINEVVLKDAEGKQIGYLSSGIPSYLKKNYDSYNTSTDAYFSNFAKVCQAISAYGDAVAALYQ